MSANSEDLSYSSFVSTKYNSGTYSFGFPSIGFVDEKGIEDVENHEATDVIDSHIINGRKGVQEMVDMADDDTEVNTSESEDSTTDDYTPLSILKENTTVYLIKYNLDESQCSKQESF